MRFTIFGVKKTVEKKEGSFCRFEVSAVPNQGNRYRASVHNELLDPCYKTGSWETHGFATDAPQDVFCASAETHGSRDTFQAHSLVSSNTRRSLPPRNPTRQRDGEREAGVGDVGITMHPFVWLPFRVSAVSETLCSRYALLQHG